MGTTTKPIPFFTDDITLYVFECTNVEHFGKNVSLREFSNGRPTSLEEILDGPDAGALYAKIPSTSEFIVGHEVT